MKAPSNIRLGIVGCGAHSHVHAAAASTLADVEIVAACDVIKERAEAFWAAHGGEAAYEDLDEMLAHSDLHGVILCTWPNRHAAQIERCFARGITNILCEKALVTASEEARRVQQLVKAHRGVLIEASVHRHQPAIRKLEALLATGEIGPVDSVRAAFHNFEPPGTPLPSGAPDWRNQKECGGGVTYDWLHYLVDSCNHFIKSPPRRVFAVGNAAADGDVIYRIYALIEYENGAVGIIENSKLASFSNALEITAAHGILTLPIAWALQGEVVVTRTRRKPEWDFTDKETYVIPKVNAYALQLEDFSRAVRGITPPLVSLEDAVVNAKTTEALVSSLKQGRAVMLGE